MCECARLRVPELVGNAIAHDRVARSTGLKKSSLA